MGKVHSMIYCLFTSSGPLDIVEEMFMRRFYDMIGLRGGKLLRHYRQSQLHDLLLGLRSSSGKNKNRENPVRREKCEVGTSRKKKNKQMKKEEEK